MPLTARTIFLIRLWAYGGPLLVILALGSLTGFSIRMSAGLIFVCLLYYGMFRFFELIEPLNQGSIKSIKSGLRGWLIEIALATIVWLVWKEPVVRIGLPIMMLLQLAIIPFGGLFEKNPLPEDSPALESV